MDLVRAVARRQALQGQAATSEVGDHLIGREASDAGEGGLDVCCAEGRPAGAVLGDPVIAHLGGRCLALEGLAPGHGTDEVHDQLEALLLTAAMDSTPDADDLIDLILPALPGDQRLAGTHAAEAPDLTDLRHLLENLAAGEQRIQDDQEAERQALEEGYERAGDLLLSGLAGGPASSPARLEEVLDVLWASQGRPEVLEVETEALHAPIALAAGHLLSLLLLARRITSTPQTAPDVFRARHEGDQVLVQLTSPLRSPLDGPNQDLRERARTHGVPVRIDALAVRLWLPIEPGS